MIKGFAVAAALGLFSVTVAVAGVAFILPWLIARQWKQRTHATER
jgi:preprotein translocase subunit SecD